MEVLCFVSVSVCVCCEGSATKTSFPASLRPAVHHLNRPTVPM